MTINLSALKVELLTGSHASVYSAAVSARDFNTLTDLVNSVSSPADTVNVGTVYALALQQCVVASEYAQLAALQRDLWNAIVTTATAGIAISHTIIRQQITTIWSAGLSATRSNLVSAQARTCTRAENLFGEGTVVNTNMIYVAFTMP